MKNNDKLLTSRKNNKKAWKHFESHGYKDHKGLVLHHKDPDMKQRDFDRYIQWNPADLIVLTRAEHRRLHMKLERKGKPQTKQHKQHISEGRIENLTKGKKVCIAKAEVLMFDSVVEAASYIGCTKQLVSQCIRSTTPNKTAYGWQITLI